MKVFDDGVIAFDKRTGEKILETEGPSVLHSTSPDRVANAKRQIQRREKEAETKLELFYKHGFFVWTIFDVGQAAFPDLSKSSLSRLMFLATYIDDDGVISSKKNNRFDHPLSRGEIVRELDCNDRAFQRFMKEVTSLGIVEESDGAYLFNTEFFRRGTLGNKEAQMLWENGRAISRLYVNATRNLYWSATGNSLNELSYLFRIMPFVNREHNIVCENPLESNVALIRPMTLGDLAEAIGYGRCNAARLQKMLTTPRFQVGKQILHAVRYSYEELGGVETHYLRVNPRVYYGGDKHEYVMECGYF